MKFKKALVTGCCGFIGSHVTRLLVKDGWYVEGVDDLSSGDLSSLSDLNFKVIHDQLLHVFDQKYRNPQPGGLLIITADFASQNILDRVSSSNYDVIFHLAANPRVEYSVKYPDLTTDENVQKTIELMTVSIGTISRFVFASSSSCYGNASTLPTSEDNLCDPSSPYGLQKLVVEQFGKLYNKLYGLDFAALRFFNVYGPGQQGNSPYSTAVSAWAHRLKNDQPLRSDGDGTQTRDMVFVEDVASAMVSAADHSEKINFEVFNVASGESFSNNEILEMIKGLLPNTKVEHAPERAGDVKHTLGSIEKIKNTLEWSPKVKFQDGLLRTLKWHDLI